MQPSAFKAYPKGLFSYHLDDVPQLKELKFVRFITSDTRAGKPYLRLNTPSAGNLHPLEMYVQIRGLKGIVSGIYHLQADTHQLVLIREVDEEGLEAVLGLESKINGMVFVMSIVPFRSFWKYGVRAFRYCYLDAGHQIAALEAALAVEGAELTFLSGFDAKCLDTSMGFDEQEQTVFAAFAGTVTQKACKPLEGSTMRVQPTDYYEAFEPFPVDQIAPAQGNALLELLRSDTLADAVISRRSARAFGGGPLGEAYETAIMKILGNETTGMSVYLVVNDAVSLHRGVYRSGKCIDESDRRERICRDLVDQRFLLASSMVIVVTSPRFNGTELAKASRLSHGLHLWCEARNIGFTGIGAFYDRKLQQLLQTDDYILYVNAIGRKHGHKE
jgi:SagB-type dehydrogenase family enzyme